MSLAVAALALVVFCGAIGFAIGRTTAPKSSSAAPTFPTLPSYTYRTVPTYRYPSYTYRTYPSYPYTTVTPRSYGEDPRGNSYTEPGVFSITFPSTHNYAIPLSSYIAGALTTGKNVQSSYSATPHGFSVTWTDEVSTTTTSHAVAQLCNNRYATVVAAGPSTIAGLPGYTCRLPYGGTNKRYVDLAYLFANHRYFFFQVSEYAGGTYAQFLAFVATFRLL
jgi:hypothetical protein